MRRIRRFWIGFRLTIRRIIFSGHSPRSIAFSTALGVFIAFLPIYGLQMLVSLAVATLFRVNRLAAMAMAWISNPFTIPPILWMQYQVGYFTMNGTFIKDPETQAKFEALGETVKEFEWSHPIDSLGSVFGGLWSLGEEILVPTLIGTVVAGAVFALLSYPVAYWLVWHYRELRRRRGLSRLVRSGYLTSDGRLAAPAEQAPAAESESPTRK